MSECYKLKIIEGKRPWFCQSPEGRILIPASESNFVTVKEKAVCCDGEWRNLMISTGPPTRALLYWWISSVHWSVSLKCTQIWY